MPTAAENIIGIYRRHTSAWTNARGNRLVEGQWIDRFVQLLPKNGRVLDIGCGSGAPIAIHLRRRGFRITGVDSSPEMIAMFRANLPHEVAVVEDMRALHLSSRFDGLLAWDSFFHLNHEHQRAMFRIFREHAEEGAALMFTSGTGHGEAIGELEGEPLYHSSLGTSEYRDLLRSSGFEVVDHVEDDEGCGGHTIWLARRS